MGDYVAIHYSQPTFTQQASATITGGQIVENTGVGTVGPSGAGSLKVVGVAAHDAVNGGKVTVVGGPGTIHETTCSGTVTAGDKLKSAAAGVIVTDASVAVGQTIGIALTTGTAAAVRWKAWI